MFRDPAFLRPGDVLHERYQLQSLLGEGCSGVVFEALQLATGQRVAVKVLCWRGQESAAAKERKMTRFEREMQLCGRLRHPNIVRLIDHGRLDDETVYTVFESVAGRDLGQVLSDQGALDPSEVKHLMMQVLDALACAHAHSVIHRDLKPSNIMIVDSGARRNAVVLDFGIGAMAEGEEDEGYVRITQTSEIVGTPAYAAPELLRGRRSTRRADLYSWGLVFLECLTGRRVNAGDSLAASIHVQLGPEPVPIPDFLADHPLGAILRSVTRKREEERADDAKALLLALDRCHLDELPVESSARSRCDPTAPPVTVVDTLTDELGPAADTTASMLHHGCHDSRGNRGRVS